MFWLLGFFAEEPREDEVAYYKAMTAAAMRERHKVCVCARARFHSRYNVRGSSSW